MPTVLVCQPSVFMEITLYTVKLDNIWELKLTCPSKDEMGGRRGHVQLSTEKMLVVHTVHALTETEGKIGVAY